MFDQQRTFTVAGSTITIDDGVTGQVNADRTVITWSTGYTYRRDDQSSETPAAASTAATKPMAVAVNTTGTVDTGPHATNATTTTDTATTNPTAEAATNATPADTTATTTATATTVPAPPHPVPVVDDRVKCQSESDCGPWRIDSNCVDGFCVEGTPAFMAAGAGREERAAAVA